jgi:hypothetical protein
MPAGSTQVDPAKLIERLTIDEVSATYGLARRINRGEGASQLPAKAVAIAMSLASERFAVNVVADEVARPAIETALETSRRVRAATPRDRDVVVELRVRGNELELHDAQGPLSPPARYPERLSDAVQDLENFATVRRLLALSDDAGIAPTDVSVELLIADSHGHRTLAPHHEALGLGDRIALRLENHTDQPLFANVFNIGLRRRITLISGPAANGVQLLPNTPTYVGTTIAGALVGFAPGWPAGLPRDQPRLDTIMVVITAEPADLRVLESGEHLAQPRQTGTPFQALLDQIATGRARGPGDTSRASAFAICWRDYRLFPLNASLDLGAPQVDGSPLGCEPPRAVAATLRIRLDTLTVALGKRLDVLVCARSTATPYCATTVIGEAPHDLVVWHGELHGPADVYVWTSTSTANHGSLAELLAAQPITTLVAALGVPDSDPRSRLAAGASLALAAMARRTLLGIAPDVATAFRGSFGGDDPGTDLNYAASASFAIAIERMAGHGTQPDVAMPNRSAGERPPLSQESLLQFVSRSNQTGPSAIPSIKLAGPSTVTPLAPRSGRRQVRYHRIGIARAARRQISP